MTLSIWHRISRQSELIVLKALGYSVTVYQKVYFLIIFGFGHYLSYATLLSCVAGQGTVLWQLQWLLIFSTFNHECPIIWEYPISTEKKQNDIKQNYDRTKYFTFIMSVSLLSLLLLSLSDCHYHYSHFYYGHFYYCHYYYCQHYFCQYYYCHLYIFNNKKVCHLIVFCLFVPTFFYFHNFVCPSIFC